MSNPEKFLIEEKPRFIRSVQGLRSIKEAANFKSPISFWQNLKSKLGVREVDRVLPEETETFRQTALKDGKSLARDASVFFMARMFNNSWGAEAEALEVGLSRIEQAYGHLKGWSNVYEKPEEAADRLRALFLYGISSYGRDFIEAHMFLFNHLGVRNLDELLKSKIGVVAPVATDYLVASAHNEFVRRFVDRNGFDLEPIALNRELSVASLHKRGGLLPFQETTQLGVLVDFIGTNSTRSMTVLALEGLYPGKVVYGNNWNRGSFFPKAYGFDSQVS